MDLKKDESTFLDLNNLILNSRPTKTSQEWQELHASAKNVDLNEYKNSENVDYSGLEMNSLCYDDYGGFSGWNGFETGTMDHLAYPTETVRSKIMEYEATDRLKLGRSKKNNKSKKQDNYIQTPAFSSIQIGRNTESRAAERRHTKKEIEWFSASNCDLSFHDISIKLKVPDSKFQDSRKQLVLPKVGSHRPPQMSISKSFSTNILQTFLKGDMTINSRMATAFSTPFLPPITSQSVKVSQKNSNKYSRYRCKLPYPKQVLSKNGILQKQSIQKQTINSNELNSNGINSHGINSHGINSHGINSNEISSKQEISQSTLVPVANIQAPEVHSVNTSIHRWKSSIPKELQSTMKTENVIRKDKMSKRSNIHQVYRVGDKNKQN